MDLNKVRRFHGPSGPMAVTAGVRDWQIGIDSEVTGLIVGRPQSLVRPGEVILPWRTVRTVGYRYPTFTDLARFKPFETKRGLSADIRTARLTGSYASGETTRHSFAYEYDEAEIANRDAAGNFPLSIREMASALAREAVLDDIERERAVLLTATATYTQSNYTTIAGGAEWDSAGSAMQADIDAAANAMSLRTGAQRSQMILYLGGTAGRAALMNREFRAARAGTAQSTSFPTFDEIARWLGIARVWSDDRQVLDTAGTALEYLYGENAILYLPSKPSGMDDMFGTYQPGATFTTNMGAALQPWRENKNTTWYFPFEQWADVKIFNDANMHLFQNTAA